MTTKKPAVANLFLKPERGQPMRMVDQVEAVAGKGLEGDHSFGRSDRQVLLVSIQMLDHLELSPGMLRENVAISDLEVDGLISGTTLTIGSSQLQISGPCEPCWKMDRIRPGLQDLLQGQRGVLAKVIKSGRIAVGDTVQIQSASSA